MDDGDRRIALAKTGKGRRHAGDGVFRFSGLQASPVGNTTVHQVGRRASRVVYGLAPKVVGRGVARFLTPLFATRVLLVAADARYKSACPHLSQSHAKVRKLDV